LTTYGSGRIEFVESELEIESIYNLHEDDGRTVRDDDPANCWRRIYLGYGGAPTINALDSTIIDNDGCAPIVETKEYSNQVQRVLASSWPMYVIRKVVDIAAHLKEQHHDKLMEEQFAVINELTRQPFKEIDFGLKNAKERAESNNKTVIADGDEYTRKDQIGSMLRLSKDLKGSIESDGIFSIIKDKLSTLGNPEKDFSEALSDLEKCISLGYSYLYFRKSHYFLTNKVEPRHKQLLEVLLDHDRREIREMARDGLSRIRADEV
jgi:hypothetical protein